MREELHVKAKVLARIACIALAENGKTCPNLHEISLAVVTAAPLLNLHDVPEGVHIADEAVSLVCEQLGWTPENIVPFLPRHSLTIKAERVAR